MPFALLLSMQAAGMITDYMGAMQQQAFNNYGAKLQEAGIDANIYQTRLETEQASLQSLKQLRATLGSQIAIAAARGTRTSAGSMVGLLTESQGNFNADDRMRRLNEMGKENQLRADKVMTILQNKVSNSGLWKSFAGRAVNTFPSSAAGWQQYGQAASSSFGLTDIGG